MILHIDMSNHYDQKSYSVIAMVGVDAENYQCNQKIKRGLVIDEPYRKDILKKYKQTEIHAVSIKFLIKDLNPIKRLIICPDINPVEKVMSLLQELRPGMFGKLKSLKELREEIGDKNIKSSADSFARDINRSFQKRRNHRRRKEFYKDGTVSIFSEMLEKDRLEFLSDLEKIRGK